MGGFDSHTPPPSVYPIDLNWTAPANTGFGRVLSYRIEESSNGTSWYTANQAGFS